MGQVLGADKIGVLSKTDATHVSLASTRITIGGQQYAKSSAIIMDLGTVGLNGLDAGSLGAESHYYVHAVASAGQLALIASLSKTAPTGYTNFKWTGWIFVTDSSSNIATTADSTTWDWIVYAPVAPTNGSMPTSSCDARYRRIGDSIECQIYVVSSGAAVSGLQLSLPDSLSIDHTKLALDQSIHGIAHINNSGQIWLGGVQVSGDHYVIFIGPNGQSSNWSSSSPTSTGAGIGLSAQFTLPIQGWKANEL